MHRNELVDSVEPRTGRNLSEIPDQVLYFSRSGEGQEYQRIGTLAALMSRTEKGAKMRVIIDAAYGKNEE